MEAFLNHEMANDITIINIKGLNLLENMKMPVQETVLQIQKLFPNIENLDLSLSEEKDVSFILAALPQLLTLNGIAVESELVEESTRNL